MNLNSITLVGRATRDPESRFTANNHQVCNFTLAVDDGYGDKKTTAFVDVTCWSKTAEAVQQYAVKGQELGVIGSLRQDSWEDKDGNKRSKLYVNAQTVQFGQKPKGAEDRQQQGGGGSYTDARGLPTPTGDHEELGEDDIPF